MTPHPVWIGISVAKPAAPAAADRPTVGLVGLTDEAVGLRFHGVRGMRT